MSTAASVADENWFQEPALARIFALLNQDGAHGPVKCGACHQVNKNGVPSRHQDKIDRKSSLWKSYEEAVKFQHTLR